MRMIRLILVVALALLAGCVHNPSKKDNAPQKSEKSATDVKPAPGSKFSKLKLGLTQIQVREMIGKPTEESTHPSGKQFIPFYFGQDRFQVTEYYYKNEGILRFGTMSLIEITVDPKSKGLQ